MVYDRTSQGGGYGRQDYGRDYGSGRDNTYSSARDYQAAGRDRDDYGRYDGRDDRQLRDYGQRQERGDNGARDDRWQDDRSGFRSANAYVADQYRSQPNDRGGSQSRDYRGSYASGGHRFADYGRNDREEYRAGQSQQQGRYGRPSQGPAQGHDRDDRGFIARAGDEVRSWFGDEEAERRREEDARRDEREHNRYDNPRDGDYHGWRKSQIAALDRDYEEYRRENRTKFENEFGTWRSSRQTQRETLTKVAEHMDVVGSDGAHVGTVDKVRGDRIILTKTDADAGGRHHSIPSNWVQSVGDRVTLSKSSDDAKRQWRDEEQSQAMFGDDKSDTSKGDTSRGDAQGGALGRSFSGTY